MKTFEGICLLNPIEHVHVRLLANAFINMSKEEEGRVIEENMFKDASAAIHSLFTTPLIQF